MAPAAKKKARQPAEDAGEPAAAKKPRDEATVAKGEFVTFLTRVKDGKYKKRSSDQDRAEAAETLQQYHTLAQEDKSSFAMAYFSNKDKKDFQWARDFIQSVTVSKVDEEACNSKYMTRNSIELGHGSNFHEAAKWKNQLFVATSLSFVYSLHAFQA